ncbi:Hypothetical predicted protein [Xyrichtys novacula]|uniref:Uncharacterized protein n=1 Tax=Xyrichtys novacula TaxID=13765 RepID=A0AAV1HNV6_XYRNO|nr:Hypothetical predicted protein [Xyrichtys novacula]
MSASADLERCGPTQCKSVTRLLHLSLSRMKDTGRLVCSVGELFEATCLDDEAGEAALHWSVHRHLGLQQVNKTV